MQLEDNLYTWSMPIVCPVRPLDIQHHFGWHRLCSRSGSPTQNIYIYIWRWIQSYQGIVQTWLVLNNSSFVFVFKCGVSVVCQLTWPLQTVSLFETRLPFIFLKDIPKQQSHPITTPQKTPGMWLAQPLTFARLIMSTARRQSHTSPILKSRFKNAHNLISKRLTEKVYQTIKRWVG